MKLNPLSARARGILGWIAAALIAATLITIMCVLSQCTQNERIEAGVALGASEANVDGYRKGVAAERAATSNQLAAAEAFRNDQAQAEDKIDEAIRDRRSPLDAAFDKLR